MQSFQLENKNWDDEPLDKGILELWLYKFKCYLGSVGRAIIDEETENKPYNGDN